MAASVPVYPVGSLPRTLSGVSSIATRGIFGIGGERPKEISCRTVDAFVAHSAYLLVTTIQRKLEESSYARVVVGLSGTKTYFLASFFVSSWQLLSVILILHSRAA